jgi:hypothetical protein
VLGQGDGWELLTDDHGDPLIGCGASCVGEPKDLMDRELDDLDEVLVRVPQEVVHIAGQLLGSLISTEEEEEGRRETDLLIFFVKDWDADDVNLQLCGWVLTHCDPSPALHFGAHQESGTGEIRRWLTDFLNEIGELSLVESLWGDEVRSRGGEREART